MLRGYRGLGFAALVALVFVSFGLGAFTMSLGYPEQQERNKSYQGGDKNKIGALSAVTNFASSGMQHTPCKKPQSEAERDLCEQWRAANAAEKSAQWAVFGVIASIVGISLLLWQIMLTREAVQDTGDATKAMREANDIAQIALENQKMIDDGRLVLTAIQVEHGSKYVKLRFSVSNIGRTDVVITKVLFIKSTKMAIEAEPPAAMSVMTSKPSILKSGEITDVYEGTGNSVSGGDNLFLTIAVSYESRYRRTTSFMCVKPQDGERRDSDGFDLCAAWEGELPQKVALLTRVRLRGT